MVTSTSSMSPARAFSSTYLTAAASRPSPIWPVLLMLRPQGAIRQADHRSRGMRRLRSMNLNDSDAAHSHRPWQPSRTALKYLIELPAGLPAQAGADVRLSCDVHPDARHQEPRPGMTDHPDSGIEIGLTGPPPPAIPDSPPRTSHLPAKVV